MKNGYKNWLWCGLLAAALAVPVLYAQESGQGANAQADAQAGGAQGGRGGRGPGANTGPDFDITVDGETYGQRALFQRNVGTQEEQVTQFPPHRIVGNLYYVGTISLASYLVVTPQGNILIDTTYERNVPVILKSVEQLGFKFSDIKIILGSHGHGDHMEGDALAKQITGAQVMAMAEDVPLLQKMTPGGKAHPIDRVLHDGDTVTLGGTTLTAVRTPGHTPGCTTWTLQETEGGKTYNVIIEGSLSVLPGAKLLNNPTVPDIVDQYRQGFRVSRALPVDIFLASHPAVYDLKGKYARMKDGGGVNVWVDPEGFKKEIDINEAMFNAVLAQQQKAAATTGN